MDCAVSQCVADFEFLRLRPHLSDGFSRPDTFQLEAASRVKLAYETDEGVGLPGED